MLSSWVSSPFVMLSLCIIFLYVCILLTSWTFCSLCSPHELFSLSMNSLSSSARTFNPYTHLPSRSLYPPCPSTFWLLRPSHLFTHPSCRRAAAVLISLFHSTLPQVGLVMGLRAQRHRLHFTTGRLAVLCGVALNQKSHTQTSASRKQKKISPSLSSN